MGSSPIAPTMTREDIYKLPKSAGIYCIKNTINGKRGNVKNNSSVLQKLEIQTKHYKSATREINFIKKKLEAMINIKGKKEIQLSEFSQKGKEEFDQTIDGKKIRIDKINEIAEKIRHIQEELNTLNKEYKQLQVKKEKYADQIKKLKVEMEENIKEL